MTALDSNVLVGLLNQDDALNLQAMEALNAAARRGPLTIAAPVFVELSAMPRQDGWDLEDFLRRTRIAVDWLLEEEVWRAAARANADYVAKRRKNFKLPRRIAADFLIGAHAVVRDIPLLTFDQRTFRAAFPSMRLIAL